MPQDSLTHAQLGIPDSTPPESALNDPVLPSLRSPFRGIDSHCGICATICAASTEKEEDPAAKLRRWRAWVLRQRAQPLGTVEAPDERAAEAAAAGPASRESGE
jgi:hypothetical protein